MIISNAVNLSKWQLLVCSVKNSVTSRCSITGNLKIAVVRNHYSKELCKFNVKNIDGKLQGFVSNREVLDYLGYSFPHADWVPGTET